MEEGATRLWNAVDNIFNLNLDHLSTIYDEIGMD